MTQTSRRPLRRERRRSPLPLFIILFILLGLCLTALSCNRTNASADSDYAGLVEPTLEAGELGALLQTYQNLDGLRFNSAIVEDYEAVTLNSKKINSVIGRISGVEAEMDDTQKTNAEEFQKATRWLFWGTARRREASAITKLNALVTTLRTNLKPLRNQKNQFMREQNDLYIKYAADEISSDEFSEMKAQVDARLKPVIEKLNSQYDAINTQNELIFAKGAVFGG